MKTLFPIALCSVLVLAGCTRREPSDTQLRVLLHADVASPTASQAPIEAGTVTCLRAWSGDSELAEGLAASAVSADGKRACRVQIDKWLADAERNPDKFTFGEVSAPRVVRRVVAIQKTQALAAVTTPTMHQVPPAMMNPPPKPPQSQPVTPSDASADLGAAGARLKEAENACMQVQQAVANGSKNRNMQRLGGFCSSNLKTLRAKMEAAAKSGNTGGLDAMANSADNIANNARRVLASAGK